MNRDVAVANTSGSDYMDALRPRLLAWAVMIKESAVRNVWPGSRLSLYPLERAVFFSYLWTKFSAAGPTSLPHREFVATHKAHEFDCCFGGLLIRIVAVNNESFEY